VLCVHGGTSAKKRFSKLAVVFSEQVTGGADDNGSDCASLIGSL
jgi:hypothetical protein